MEDTRRTYPIYLPRLRFGNLTVPGPLSKADIELIKKQIEMALSNIVETFTIWGPEDFTTTKPVLIGQVS